GLPAEIGNAVIVQNFAVRIGAEVAFEGAARSRVQRLLPAKSGKKSHAEGVTLLQAQNQRFVIRCAVRAGESELRKLLQWTAAVCIGDGGARPVDSRVEIRGMEQVAAGGTLERDPSDHALGQALLDREVPLVNAGVGELRVEGHQQVRGDR